MQAYDAVFSVPAHIPWGQGVHTVGPSLFGLYKGANGQYTYDRYVWDPAQGKPWWGDAPAESGEAEGKTLTDLFNVDPFTAEGGTSLKASQPLDAALCLDEPTAVYLFQGGLVRKMSVKGSTFKATLDTPPQPVVRDTDTYAQPIEQVFGSSHNSPAFAFDRIRAALYSPEAGGSGKIWFFDHDSTNCVSVDHDTFVQDQKPPVAISTAWKLDGAPSGLVNALTTAGKPFWATTQILVTDQTHYPDGQSQDKGYFGIGTGTDWCPFTLSTTTPAMALYTTPGDTPAFTVPTGVTAVTVELWGPGGSAGKDGIGPGYYPASGGNGGSGAYIRHLFTPAPSSPIIVHVGGPADYTCYPATSPTLIAGGGGGGGGGGGNTDVGSGGAGGVGNGAAGQDARSAKGGGSGSGGSGGRGGSAGSGGSGSKAAGSSGSVGSANSGGSGGSGASGGAGAGAGGTGSGAGGGGGVGGSTKDPGAKNGGSGGGGGAGGAGYGGGGGAGGGGSTPSPGYGGGGGGGGGGQGGSKYDATSIFKPHSDNDLALPYVQLGSGSGAGGRNGGTGGNGAARLTW